MIGRKRASVADLLADPPLLHFWNGRQRVGGLAGQAGRQFADSVLRHAGGNGFDVLETGAGLSTLMFLALGARSVTSVAPDVELEVRIREAANDRGLDYGRVEFIADRSERALPKLMDAGRNFGIVLLDGGHGWPTVFVDFCYANACMRAGSLLMLDDCQLHSVRQLFLLLASQPGYRQLSQSWEWKLGVFAKDTDEPFLREDQPFINVNSPHHFD